ncbi:hypothetical protein KRP22_013077 [Phytophthora ramorum]|nr:Cysteine synthase 1 [Phytophthora ramorum]
MNVTSGTNQPSLATKLPFLSQHLRPASSWTLLQVPLDSLLELVKFHFWLRGPPRFGNTPLLELTTLSKLTGCKLLAKAEYANPSGSIKDRVAKSLILDAEERGLLKPGGTIIEATGGKQKDPDVKVWLIDPEETAAMSVFVNNERATSTIEDGFEVVPMATGSTIAEGVAALSRVTQNLRESIVDRGVTATNQEIVDMAYFLLTK